MDYFFSYQRVRTPNINNVNRRLLFSCSSIRMHSIASGKLKCEFESTKELLQFEFWLFRGFASITWRYQCLMQKGAAVHETTKTDAMSWDDLNAMTNLASTFSFFLHWFSVEFADTHSQWWGKGRKNGTTVATRVWIFVFLNVLVCDWPWQFWCLRTNENVDFWVTENVNGSLILCWILFKSSQINATVVFSVPVYGITPRPCVNSITFSLSSCLIQKY